jgi:hypothetical protein
MNKILMRVVFLFVLLNTATPVQARHFWRGELMPQSQVAKRWGTDAFDETRFKNAKAPERAKMAAELLANQKLYIGIDRADIRKRLGGFDGHYFSDMFPTYMIERAKDRDQDSWQIVFLLDREERISEIVVHKNCCDR